MGLLSKAVATKSTLTGLAIGLAIGGALALAVHGVMSQEGRK